MKNIPIVVLVWMSMTASAQIKVFLKDRDTGKPIEYANVWQQNNVITASDSLGIFYLTGPTPRLTYKISALGYEPLDSIEIAKTATILMAAKAIVLKDVVLPRARNSGRTKIGKLKSPDVFIGCNKETLVPMIAKYFPNETGKMLFLDKVRIKALTGTKNRIAAITLYSVNKDGKPDEPISTKSIIHHFKKGHHVAEADFQNMNIAFPDNGIFVVINFLPLEQNRQYGKSNQRWFYYEPLFDGFTNPGKPDYWFFGKSGWERLDTQTLSMQLILTD